MFKKLSNSAKIGLLVEVISGICMGVLVLLDKPIPDLIACLFFLGLIGGIIPDLLKRKK